MRFCFGAYIQGWHIWGLWFNKGYFIGFSVIEKKERL